MRRKIKIFLIMFVSFIFLASTSTLTSEFSVDKAKRVDEILKRIAKRKRNTPFLRKITFSQASLNSYLNIFYTKRYAPEVKYIKLKLEKNNFASGIMKIKLKDKKYVQVPSFLRDIEVEISGKVECEKYRMRYVFDKIKINGTSFSPELLDEAFAAAQINAKVKKSMFDWFDLFPGIKKVIIDYKKITLFY
jgi:hypothetical protein